MFSWKPAWISLPHYVQQYRFLFYSININRLPMLLLQLVYCRTVHFELLRPAHMPSHLWCQAAGIPGTWLVLRLFVVSMLRFLAFCPDAQKSQYIRMLQQISISNGNGISARCTYGHRVRIPLSLPIVFYSCQTKLPLRNPCYQLPGYVPECKNSTFIYPHHAMCFAFSTPLYVVPGRMLWFHLQLYCTFMIYLVWYLYS